MIFDKKLTKQPISAIIRKIDFGDAGARGGYLVETWVRGCAAQIGCIFGLSGLAMAHFYLKIGLDNGRVFAKSIIFDEFVLWFTYRLSESTYASQFTL